MSIGASSLGFSVPFGETAVAEKSRRPQPAAAESPQTTAPLVFGDHGQCGTAQGETYLVDGDAATGTGVRCDMLGRVGFMSEGASNLGDPGWAGFGPV